MVYTFLKYMKMAKAKLSNMNCSNSRYVHYPLEDDGQDYIAKNKMNMKSETQNIGDLEPTNCQQRGRSLEFVFATGTTCHGLRHLVEANSWVIRGVWSVACMVAFIVLLCQCVFLIQGYFMYSTVTQVEITVHTSLHIHLLSDFVNDCLALLFT